MRYDTEYTVGADTGPARRHMALLVQNAKTTGIGVAQGLGSANAGIGKLTAGLAAAGVAATALTVLPGVIKDVVQEASEIGKVADRLGVGVEALQELRFAAEKFGVAAGETDKAIAEFNKRIGEAKTGTGNLKRILDANGISLTDQNGVLKSSLTLMSEYADLIANASSQQDRAYLAQEAFSDSGQKMINVLQNGSQAFRQSTQNAKDLGAAIDEDLIRKAEVWDDRWADISKNMEVNFKTGMLGIVSEIDAFATALDSLVDGPSVRKFLQLFDNGVIRQGLKALPVIGPASQLIPDDFGRKTADSVAPEAADPEAERRAKRIADAFGTVKQKVTAADEALKELLRRRGLEERGLLTNLPGFGETIKALQEEFAALSRSSLEQKKYLALKKEGVSADSERGREIIALVEKIHKARIATEARKKAQQDANSASQKAVELSRRQKNRIDGVVEALKNEAAVIGLSVTERKKLQALQRAGVDANSVEGQSIARLVDQIAAKEQAVAAASAAQRRLEQDARDIAEANNFLASSTFNAFDSMVTGATSAEEAMKGLALGIARAVAQAALLGQGPLAGVFGTRGVGALTNLISGGTGVSTNSVIQAAAAAGQGGFFAKGGITRRPAIFGEDGPEAAVPLPDGRRIPVDLRLPATPAMSMPAVPAAPTLIPKAGAPRVELNIVNNSPEPVSQEQRNSGDSTMIDVMIGQSIAQGRQDKAMQRFGGVKPKPIAR